TLSKYRSGWRGLRRRRVGEVRRTGNMPVPARVLPLGIIGAEVNAARFIALKRRPDHETGDRQEVLQLPAGPAVEFSDEGVTTPEGHGSLRFQQAGAIAYDSHAPHHEAAQRIGHVGHVERFLRMRREPAL